MVDFSIENEYGNQGYSVICGVDEAGRGPLAGPVYAAAVILSPDTVIEGLNDSKKLTEKKREALFPVIQEKAIAYGIGFATECEIDEINILSVLFKIIPPILYKNNDLTLSIIDFLSSLARIFFVQI